MVVISRVVYNYRKNYNENPGHSDGEIQEVDGFFMVVIFLLGTLSVLFAVGPYIYSENYGLALSSAAAALSFGLSVHL